MKISPEKCMPIKFTTISPEQYMPINFSGEISILETGQIVHFHQAPDIRWALA